MELKSDSGVADADSNMRGASTDYAIIPPLVRPHLANIIADHLRRGIGDGTISDRLPSERNLADMAGVSRPVVREALKRLEMEGLLLRKHGQVTRVMPPKSAAP